MLKTVLEIEINSYLLICFIFLTINKNLSIIKNCLIIFLVSYKMFLLLMIRKNILKPILLLVFTSKSVFSKSSIIPNLLKIKNFYYNSAITFYSKTINFLIVNIS